MIRKTAFRKKKNGEPYFDSYCRNPEQIENYELANNDETQTWECHHKLEAWFTTEELIELDRYFDVEPRELIFLKRSEHYKWPHLGRTLGSEKRKGKPHGPHSEEAKRKMSEAKKGKPQPWRHDSMRGKIPWNKGKKMVIINNKKVWLDR